MTRETRLFGAVAPEPEPSISLDLDFLLGRLLAEGVEVETGANHPILLDDEEKIWLIETGQVNVFSVRLADGGEAIDRRHVLASGAGDLLFGVGMGGGEECAGLLAVSSAGARIRALPKRRWQELSRESRYRDQAAALLDHWLAALSRGVAGANRPARSVDLTVGEEAALPPGAGARTYGGPLWVKQLDGETRLFGDARLPAWSAGAIVPIASGGWLESSAGARVMPFSTAEYLAQDPHGAALARFHRAMILFVAIRRRDERLADAARLRKKQENDRVQVGATFVELASVLDGAARPTPVDDTGDALYAASRIVCYALGVDLGPAPTATRRNADPIVRIARASGLRVRQVALRDRWWRGDHGPLVAFRGEKRDPVALLPTSATSYDLVEPGSGARTRLTDATARDLEPFAYTFYRRLPTEKLRIRDLLRFGMFGCRRDLITIAITGLAAAVLALATPLATGLVFDTIIPGAQRSQLLQVALTLMVAEIAIALFDGARSFAILRVEGRLGGALQTALWDRLLDLPAKFFRDFSSGDLATRAAGVDEIRRALSATAVGTMISGTFSIVSAALLFYYDPHLAWFAVGLVAIAVVVALVNAARQLRLQRPLAELHGKLEGLVLQLINGVAKLRVAAAEQRAFARWAQPFAEQRRLGLRARAPLRVWSAIYPIAAMMVVYWVLGTEEGQNGLSTGRFIAFCAAFSTFLANTLDACQSTLNLIDIGPTFDRLRPIIETIPEIDKDLGDPGPLTGEIEIAHVSFRYGDDGPLILDDVSLTIRPGEFVALVGASGSGKSTLLRLLLGFEKPSAGTIYYNGQDLSGLDVGEVRRQMGVVLQNGKLLTGDILSNINGSSAHLTIDDAMSAARRAGFDRDLEQMPMGLHTFVSEGGSTLSGGQRQRLLIARSIVRNPRILFFDEATSALDNRTQAIVSDSVEKLEATRIVIAHRLSTILNADRIVVLEGGRMVQSGTYTELVKQPGPFAELAKRQLA
jgi:NHLM bacteriocin system ABC transporter ATP-binding protein